MILLPTLETSGRRSRTRVEHLNFHPSSSLNISSALSLITRKCIVGIEKDIILGVGTVGFDGRMHPDDWCFVNNWTASVFGIL